MKMVGINKSIFIKILLVIVMLVYLIFIHTINTSKRDLNQKSIELTRSQIAFTFKMLNLQIQNILEQQNTIIVDTEFVKYINEKYHSMQYRDVEMINSLKKSMSKIMYDNDMVSEVRLYLPETGKEITTQKFEDIDMAQFINMLAKTDDEKVFENFDGSMHITVRTPFLSYVESGVTIPYALMTTELSSEKMKSHLDRFFNSKFMEYTVFLADENSTVVHKDSEFIKHTAKNTSKGSFSYSEGIGVYKDNDTVCFITSILDKRIKFVMTVSNDYYYNPVKKYNSLLVFVSLLVLAVVISFFLIIKAIVNKPMSKLLESFKRVERGDINFNIHHDRDDEFKFLYNGFNKMLERIRELIHQVYEQKFRTQHAELKQLQYQINPHFLYNSLLVLYETIKFSDEENAMKMARHLSSYYKYITGRKEENITLQSEIVHVRNYVNIQDIRYSGRIKVNILSIPKKLEGCSIPKLVLQPVVENAFMHGMKNKEQNGMIDIKVSEDNGFLKICVEDNGDDTDETLIMKIRKMLNECNPDVNGTGLVNVHRRFRIGYGEASGIYVSRSSLGGLKVVLNMNKSILKTLF